MMRAHAIHLGALVSLLRYDHPAGPPHRDPDEEVSSHHAVSFIECGSFDLFHRGRHWRMDAATLFVTYPGLSYRCAHAGGRPDDVSFSVHYTPRLVEDLESTIGRRWTRHVPAAPLTNRLAYLRQRLYGLARTGEAAMAATTLAGELLAALADPTDERAPLLGAGHVARYARRIAAACELLSEHSSRPHTLEATAHAVGMSPFHFSRVFRQMVGIPPHRYLL